MNQRAIARELTSRMSLRGDIRSTSVFLSQILSGRRPLPVEWESHLLAILECESRQDAAKLFPQIRFNDGREFEVELVVNQQRGVVPSGKLDYVLDALTALKQFGIDVEARVRKR